MVVPALAFACAFAVAGVEPRAGECKGACGVAKCPAVGVCAGMGAICCGVVVVGVVAFAGAVMFGAIEVNGAAF